MVYPIMVGPGEWLEYEIVSASILSYFPALLHRKLYRMRYLFVVCT